ncbi:phosphoethanolamine transferase [Escherichia coli]|uniref:Phosphoethanolamine transferase n=1 Tax=Escherichia coli TaxID=562 RepID=A0A376LD78_ECOLX|nr:phosphoethanolamine transferase [Escherichia coli]
MRYIKSITQQKLSFLLAIYIGLFMNGAVFYRRFGSYAHDFTVWKGISAVVELAATVLVTFFLLRLLSLFGRRSWRILASLVVLFSAGASYYMTFLNVVIGYGIIASVMTTDIDLSKEVVGLNFILWLIAVSALPLILIWNNRCRYTLLRQLRTPGQRIRKPGGRRTGRYYGLGTDSFCWISSRRKWRGRQVLICRVMAASSRTLICHQTGFRH